MADELNTPTHRWYQPRNNIKLPNTDFSRDTIFDSGIQKIDAWINSQPWGSPIPALFAAGEAGAWYDPSDINTLFQDSAGTTRVTAAGQPVGLMLDKSGRGNNATQATPGSRPLYQIDGTGRPYLSFDGVDDGLVTGTMTTGTSTLQVFSGLRKLSDAAVGLVAELGTAIPNGAFYLAAPNTIGTGTYGFSSRGTSQVTFTTTAIYPAPITSVVTGIADITAPSISVRYNGSSLGTVFTTQGTGPYSNLPLNIGRRGSGTLPYNGYLYGLIVRFGANLSADTISATETWMNGKTGAY